VKVRIETPWSSNCELPSGIQTLVWIDDYKPALTLYKSMFELSGFRVLTASDGATGIELVATNRVDAVVTDYEMPGMNGEAVATLIKQSEPNLPVIMFSGSAVALKHAGHVVDAFCDKAGPRKELLAVIHKLIGNRSLSSIPTRSGEKELTSRLPA
jgi:CheY-like chemotaxis protein